MPKYILCFFLYFLFIFNTGLLASDEEDLATHLQDISVTIKAGMSTGSGVIITRNVKSSPTQEQGETVNFVWTAGHVVDGLRNVRKVIDPNDGRDKQIVEFKDAQIVKELIEKGRKVGQLEMDAKILKYSDASNGEDLALLMIRKRNFVNASAKFYLEDSITPIGTELFHVGSLLGQSGANSMTSGIVSQVGRVLNIGSGDGIIFDQTTVTAFPGSSGGGVFLAKSDHRGKYIGMLVRGAGENFNLIVPIRRMIDWAKREDILWSLDANVETPLLKDILDMKLENPSSDHSSNSTTKNFPFLIETKNEAQEDFKLSLQD